MVSEDGSSQLPSSEEMAAPRALLPQGVPVVEVDRLVGEPASAFPLWAARQYWQLVAPLNQVLAGTSRSSLAQRGALSRGAVQSALDGTAWPQLQTVVRLANLAGVELFGLAGRDLVEHGPPLAPDEQALLLAYRRMPPPQRRRMIEQLRSSAADRPAPS